MMDLEEILRRSKVLLASLQTLIYKLEKGSYHIEALHDLKYLESENWINDKVREDIHNLPEDSGKLKRLLPGLRRKISAIQEHTHKLINE